MRIIPSLVLGAFLSVAALTACDRPADPAAPDANVSPSLNGASVDRFSTTSFLLIYDPATQLMAAHFPSDLCTPSGAYNIVDVHRVLTPSPIGQRAVTVSGTETEAIYHADSPADAGVSATINSFGSGNLVDDGTQLCSFLLGPTRIAEGQVERVSTFSLASFHLRATGTVQGVDGQDYRLTEEYQLNADVHDPFNPATFTEPVIKVDLQPAR